MLRKRLTGGDGPHSTTLANAGILIARGGTAFGPSPLSPRIAVVRRPYHCSHAGVVVVSAHVLTMSQPSTPICAAVCVALVIIVTSDPRLVGAGETSAEGWIELAGDEAAADWNPDHRGWSTAGDAALRDGNERRLQGTSGAGVLLSDGSSNLSSREEFQDVELKLEFMVPRGSNSGVKLNGLYEIQIRDTSGVEKPTADDCGGVYPRAELGPPYRYLDDGVPPRVNAARPAGEWQTLEISFVAPRFDAAGKKTENARFVRVVLNGEVIHENVDLQWATGAAWDDGPELARGPLLLQGDHGPVAFRRIALRPLSVP